MSESICQILTPCMLGRSSLQDPLQILHQGVHQPSWSHPRAPTQRAQEGACVRGRKLVAVAQHAVNEDDTRSAGPVPQ